MRKIIILVVLILVFTLVSGKDCMLFKELGVSDVFTEEIADSVNLLKNELTCCYNDGNLSTLVIPVDTLLLAYMSVAEESYENVHDSYYTAANLFDDLGANLFYMLCLNNTTDRNIYYELSDIEGLIAFIDIEEIKIYENYEKITIPANGSKSGLISTWVTQHADDYYDLIIMPVHIGDLVFRLNNSFSVEAIVDNAIILFEKYAY